MAARSALGAFHRPFRVYEFRLPASKFRLPHSSFEMFCIPQLEGSAFCLPLVLVVLAKSFCNEERTWERGTADHRQSIAYHSRRILASRPEEACYNGGNNEQHSFCVGCRCFQDGRSTADE